MYVTNFNSSIKVNLRVLNHNTISMNKFYENISDALNMLYGLEKDLNIRHLTPNELKVFYTIIIRDQPSIKLLKNYPLRVLLA
jgi:hypothetical protein